MPDPLRALREAHDQMRRAEFDSALLERVVRYDQHWRGLRRTNEPAYIQGRCVVAEAMDYFGLYREASDALAEESEIALEDLTDRPLRSTLSSPEQALWKRRVWLAMALAQIRYREERYGQADRLLKNCGIAIEALNPAGDALYGTRSRHMYLSGQVARQVGNYEEARRLFRLGVQWAARRFVAATRFAEIANPITVASPLSAEKQLLFDRSRLMANWTVGKAQALGLGWIDSTTGRLDSADLHLHAGYAMLRGTGDWIHRAYAMLLIGVVWRARAGYDPKDLASAIACMVDAKRALGSHPHRLRACYELAQAYLRSGDINRATAEAETLLAELPRSPEPRQGRWRCNGIIIKSRIERIAGNADRAVALAREAEVIALRAERAARSGTSSEALIEASIACGEALLKRSIARKSKTSGTDIVDSIRYFERAQKLGSSNPKTIAVCHLHLAHARYLIGHTREAKEEYSTWPARYSSLVEHGFVHRLADDVGKEIRLGDTFFVGSDLAWVETAPGVLGSQLTAPAIRKRLEEFLARRARELEGSVEKAAERLNVHEATISRWRRDKRKKK